MSKRPIDMKGKQFGNLTVIGRVPPPPTSQHKQTYWNCQCNCGKFAIVSGGNLRSGRTNSCGCLRSTISASKGKPLIYLRRGDIGIGITHSGGWFIFSWSDYEKIKSYQWVCAKNGSTRARLRGSKGVILELSRYIIDAPEDMYVDHINRNRKDNCRNNLRLCTPTENARNRNQRGYYYDRNRKKYVAVITIGSYDTAEEALQARVNAEQILFGEFAPIREAVNG